MSDFRAHKADILVGTQMIVKGHDFPKVTLVGILCCGFIMYAGDYMACERTFGLLVQVAGGKSQAETALQAMWSYRLISRIITA